MTMNSPSIDRLRQTYVSMKFYSNADEDMLRWLCSFDFSNEYNVRNTNRGGRRKTCSPKVFEKLLTGGGNGLSVEVDPAYSDCLGVDQVVISHRRDHGVRWISVVVRSSPKSAWPNWLLEASEVFDKSIETLNPIFAILQFGQRRIEGFANSVRRDGLPIPYEHYVWRNYITPQFAEGRLLGDGTAIEEPVCIDFGPTPFVELAQRDRAQRLLEPMLPPRNGECQ